MCSTTELHAKMRDKIKEEINKAGGRRALAEDKGFDYGRIYNMAEGVESSYPPRDLFEKIFGKLDLEEEDDTIAVTGNTKIEVEEVGPANVEFMAIPLTIDCPEYDELRRMLNMIDKDLVIGFINR